MGVGIVGAEGVHAANASDFSIGRFKVCLLLFVFVGHASTCDCGLARAVAGCCGCPLLQFLKRLLLVHGRWNYNRMAIVVCYMFFKNITFVLTQYWCVDAHVAGAYA